VNSSGGSPVPLTKVISLCDEVAKSRRLGDMRQEKKEKEETISQDSYSKPRLS